MSADATQNAPRSMGLGAGCVWGTLLSLIALGGIGFAASSASRIPLTSLCSIAFVLWVVVAREAAGPDSTSRRAIALLPTAPLIVLGAVAEELRPIVSREGVAGGEVLAFFYIGLPSVIVFCMLTGLAGGQILARWRPAPENDARPPRDRAARASIIASSAVLLLALPSWITRPAADRYVATLPLLGTLEALPGTSTGPQCEDRPVVEQSAVFGSIHVRRNNRCGCGVSLANGVEPPGPSLSFMTWYKIDLGSGPYSPCGKLEVRQDAMHHLVIVDDRSHEGPRAYRYSPDVRGELRPEVDIVSADLAGATGPSSWRVLPALLGLAIAVAALRSNIGGRRDLAITAALLPALPLAAALLRAVLG